MEPMDSHLLDLTVRLQILERFVIELAQTQPLDTVFQRLAQQLEGSDSLLKPELQHALDSFQRRVQQR